MSNTTDNLPHHIPIQPAHEPAPRVAQRWQCPDCHNGITLHVRLRHAPVCNNKAVHSRRHVEMKREKKSSPR
jgi:hypothetical protein